eukprot:gene2069-1941_t
MGKLFVFTLEGKHIYACHSCNSHFSFEEEIISKHFHGRHGKAYLFNTAVNLTTGIAEERTLLTGVHVVADLYCNKCTAYVGWKYIDAYEEKEKYKVGKFILERAKIKKELNWNSPYNSDGDIEDDDDEEEEDYEEVDDEF